MNIDIGLGGEVWNDKEKAMVKRWSLVLASSSYKKKKSWD